MRPWNINLKCAIEASGISQNEIARRCGVGSSTVSSWVREKSPQQPTITNIINLLEALDMSFDEVFLGTMPQSVQEQYAKRLVAAVSRELASMHEQAHISKQK